MFVITFGIARFRNEKISPWFRIGQSPGIEYSSNDAPAGAFPLVKFVQRTRDNISDVGDKVSLENW